MAFKVLCVDHVGVAVNDLALIKKQMKDLLNLDKLLQTVRTERSMRTGIPGVHNSGRPDCPLYR